MRFLIQRVNKAEVTIEGRTAGAIEEGVCVFVGVSNTDTMEIADKMMRMPCITQLPKWMDIQTGFVGKTEC